MQSAMSLETAVKLWIEIDGKTLQLDRSLARRGTGGNPGLGCGPSARGANGNTDSLGHLELHDLVHEGVELARRKALRSNTDHGLAIGKSLGEDNPLSNVGDEYGDLERRESPADIAANRGVDDAPVDEEDGTQAVVVNAPFVDELHGLAGSPDIGGRRGLQRNENHVRRDAGAFGLRTMAIPHPHLFQETL